MKGEKMERERENGETEWAHSSNESDREWRERMEREKECRRELTYSPILSPFSLSILSLSILSLSILSKMKWPVRYCTVEGGEDAAVINERSRSLTR
jgi:hypothetical protein